MMNPQLNVSHFRELLSVEHNCIRVI